MGRIQRVCIIIEAISYRVNNVSVTPTCGSVLIINPVRNLSLPLFLSNGSLGQFSFRITLTVKNYTGVDIVNPEIVVITANTGLFSTQSGSSLVQTALLNMDLVTEVTSQKASYSSSEYERLRGGGLSDNIASAMKHIPLIKKIICESKIGDMQGSGRSGGMSAKKSKMDYLSF